MHRSPLFRATSFALLALSVSSFSGCAEPTRHDRGHSDRRDHRSHRDLELVEVNRLPGRPSSYYYRDANSPTPAGQHEIVRVRQ